MDSSAVGDVVDAADSVACVPVVVVRACSEGPEYSDSSAADCAGAAAGSGVGYEGSVFDLA